MRQALKIAIVGAGPAGLAAALLLSRDGHEVTLVERFETPAPVGSGLLLQPTGLAILSELGLFDAVMARGAHISRIAGVEQHSDSLVLDARYGLDGSGRFGLGVHRNALFSCLYDAVQAAGIEIKTGISVDEATQTGRSVEVRQSDGRNLGAFDMLVDASGSHSRLVGKLFPKISRKTLRYGAYWANVDWHEGAHSFSALSQRYLGARKMASLLPLGQPDGYGAHKAALFWSLKHEDVAEVVEGGIERWRSEVVSLWPEIRPFVEQIDKFEQMTLASYRHHTLKVPYRGHVVMIGDAAHSASPQLGQGCNMALLDAYALRQALRTHTDVSYALPLYASMRRWHIRLFQFVSYVFTPFYQSDSHLLPFLRNQLIPSLAKTGWGQNLLGKMISGMLIDPFKPIGHNEPDWFRIWDEN